MITKVTCRIWGSLECNNVKPTLLTPPLLYTRVYHSPLQAEAVAELETICESITPETFREVRKGRWAIF